MRNTISVLLFLFIHSFYAQVSIEKEPRWVIKETFNTTIATPQNGINGGAEILLFTEQVNVDLEEVYYKSVGKAIDYNGIQNISSVSADYDPTYQKLRFHKVEVIRDGKTINRLNYKDIQTARRETNSENFIYDGSITAFMNIPDVRIGDITIFSYSIKGFNPIQKNKFTGSFVLNLTSYVDKITNHIFSSRKLKVEVLNSDIPVKEKLKNGIIHYSWIDDKVTAIPIEENTPIWHIENATAFFSEYESWAEVIKWGSDLFSFNESDSNELNTVSNEIMKKYPNEGDRISAALKFVQNEVRYLALHSGIGGYKPNDPGKVAVQRFGDCKDKSVLLVALLDKMNIEAYPTLVNTTLKEVWTRLMPSSRVFDHCIVKVIDKKGTNLWYDPTMTNQGGSYLNTFIPDYQYGLVLDSRLESFDTISNFQNNMVEAFSTFKLNNFGGGADLQIKSHYHNGEADYIRSILKNNSHDLLEKELLSNATKNYGRATSKGAFTFVDDSIKNEIVLLEQYRLDSIWNKSLENRNFVNFSIIPFNLTNSLAMPTELKRSTPYAISYPMVRKHNFEVQLPHNISIQPENFTINSDFFYYDYTSKYDSSSKKLELSYYYKSQNNHVTPIEFDVFYDDMNQLNNNIGYYISANNSKNWTTQTSVFSIKNILLFGLGLVVLIVIIVGVTIYAIKSSNKRKSSKTIN